MHLRNKFKGITTFGGCGNNRALPFRITVSTAGFGSAGAGSIPAKATFNNIL